MVKRNPLKSCFLISRSLKRRNSTNLLKPRKNSWGSSRPNLLSDMGAVGNVLQLINPMFMSAFLIFSAAVQLFGSGEIYNDLRYGVELSWGYLLSAVVAVPFGIMVGWYKRASYIFDPFINAMNATPRVALLPLVIIWLGIGILSKVGIIFLGAVFPILINARDGVKTTPHNLLTAARSFGASEWIVFKSVFPSTIPFILSGLRLGLSGAIVGVMVGELYAATAGIGLMISCRRHFPNR
jgi:NitT/TauT family transport system permease protein